MRNRTRHQATENTPREATETEISGLVIGAAIEVHRAIGPGLLESVYQKCLVHEFRPRGIGFERQARVPVIYTGITVGDPLVLDLVIPGRLIVEVKSVESLSSIHEAQLLTYLRLTGIRLGLLINFNVEVLRNGVRRLSL